MSDMFITKQSNLQCPYRANEPYSKFGEDMKIPSHTHTPTPPSPVRYHSKDIESLYTLLNFAQNSTFTSCYIMIRIQACQRATDKLSSYPLGTAESAVWAADGTSVTYTSMGDDGVER